MSLIWVGIFLITLSESIPNAICVQLSRFKAWLRRQMRVRLQIYAEVEASSRDDRLWTDAHEYNQLQRHKKKNPRFGQHAPAVDGIHLKN